MEPEKNQDYESDFYGWANRQATLLREGNLQQADIKNIAEEIESMGKSEKRELISRLTVLYMHLLKWQYQPNKRSRSWEMTITEQREKLDDHLKDNHSLRARLNESIETAYPRARRKAVFETGLVDSMFPKEPPFTFEQASNENFWPESNI